MIRWTTAVAAGAICVFVVVGALALTAPSGRPASSPTGSMRASDVEAVAVSQLEAMARQRAITTPAIRIASVQLVEAGGASSLDIGVPDNLSGNIWIVRAEGPFVAQFGPPGRGPLVGESGYFIIDDRTGDVLGMGIP